jgi:hypothetical protein
MKTEVIMNSTDRELFGVTIKQSSKNSFLSVSDLQKAYEKARWQYGWSDRKVNDILQTNETKERVYYLLKESNLIKTDLLGFMEMVKSEGLTKVLKGLGVYKTTGRGENKSTYADPYIWVLLAMELNPMLYAKVIIWMTDTLIFDRLEAGAEFLPMNTAIKSIIEKPNYPEYSKTINKKVFGVHKTGMRQLASAKELRKITDIEKYVIKCIEQGFVKTEEEALRCIINY